ncbi:unannotated protein [freshwater metagenome]|uniref:Unannotated protein n=1 Tax=freshwater metagenome TaxID=449393 RepID=A0A6J6A415_9ZZZZ
MCAADTVGEVCGRYVSSSTPAAIAEFFGAAVDGEPLAPSFNVAPTNDVYAIVAASDGARRVQTYRWGLVPSWAKDVRIGSKMINARAETLGEKPSFKGLFRTHRLLVPMDGFYEWQQGTGLTAAGKPAKTPMFIHRADGAPLAAAGLWAAWREPGADPSDPWLHTLTVITTSANATMAPVHDRMPVLMEKADWAEWLDNSHQDLAALQRLLVPAPEGVLTMHAVSTAVNAVRNKGPELVEPVGR